MAAECNDKPESAVEATEVKGNGRNTVEEPAGKKTSPFLASTGSKDAEDDVIESEIEGTKQQHEHIDKLTEGNSVFNAVCKLYFLSDRTKKLETRGEGKLMILRDKADLFKILMIRDKVMLVGCNHYIAKACPLTKATKVPRSWLWVALNDKSDAEDKKERITYFVTFKTDGDSEDFERTYKDCQAKNAERVLVLKKGRDAETVL